jgi:hypothetical protein
MLLLLIRYDVAEDPSVPTITYRFTHSLTVRVIVAKETVRVGDPEVFYIENLARDTNGIYIVKPEQ